jgi:hypothetical protein
MKKPTATHTVTRSAARFGVPDPIEVCNLVAESVPASALRDADAILDLGQGCCGISRAVAKRLVREGYTDQFGAMFKLHGIDNNLALVKKAKHLGFINSICADIDQLEEDRKYKVIVGNPPYTNPSKGKKVGPGCRCSGAPLWAKFVRKSTELLEDGGFLVLLIPSAVATPGSRGMSAAKGLTLRSITFGMEKYFNVSTNIALVVWEKTTEERELKVNDMTYPKDLPIADVKDQAELDRLKKIWSGNSAWRYMDNRGHHKRENLENILVVRRMYNGDELVCHHGLDMSRFDRESVLGLENVTPKQAEKWSKFFSSDDGRFLRRVVKYGGNMSAEFLKRVNLESV